MSILKLYLTSLEPDMSQTIYSQSIGGYVSNSLIYPETTVSSIVGLYDTSVSLDTPSSGNWSEWTGIEYININNELMKVSPVSNGSISVTQRGYNGIVNMHIKDDIARASSSKELFNDVFNDEHKQYRCIALKNVSSLTEPSGEQTATDISVYFKQSSRNSDSVIRIALEKPTNQYLNSISTSWSTMQIIDTSLIGIYLDNHFKESYLKILSGEGTGQAKIISSFDSETGTYTFYNSFSSSYDYSINVKYEVFPSPAQRIKTGTEVPTMTGENIIPFFVPDENTPMRFIIEGSEFSTSDLAPNDILYIWLEREVKKGTAKFENNDLVLNINYGVS